MPTHPQTIEQFRAVFETEGFRKEAVDVGDIAFPYYVIPAEELRKKKPDLLFPLFALRLTPPPHDLWKSRGNPSPHTLFAVSDHVPARWRPHWVRHEVREYVELVLRDLSQYSGTTDTVPNGCEQCSQQEWHEVLEAFMPQDCVAYAVLRAEFFGKLVDWAAAHPSREISPQSIGNFRRSHEFWMGQL